jgi:hypothetical protein
MEQVMRRLRAWMLVCLVLATGALAGSAPAIHAATPTLNPKMWDRLVALHSYHIDSALKMTGGSTGAVSVSWSEDTYGTDYHLVMHASTSSTQAAQTAELYYVKGHYYAGVAGHFADVGALGKQMSAPVLALTVNYWATLTKSAQGAQYVGRVMTAGRPADRFKVDYAVAVPGVTSGTSTTGGQHVNYTNTVDVDLQTHAPVLVSGTFQGTDAQGHAISLTTRFAVTRIGKVPPIKAPPTIGIAGL